MKKTLVFIFFCGLIVGCSKSDDGNNNNPYLPNYAFDTGNLINTIFPQYDDLNYPGGHLIVRDPYGINGFVLYYAGGNNYSAFEITDPNHALSTCSTLTVEGLIATCSCEDGNAYDILNGIIVEGTSGQYPLKRYYVEANANIIRVYNN